ncbi:hypothetical protein [Variovorax paradoxus]|uniref:hypothetical protein n=1 Tax=Variovorax paradoxus TaxID=34073 RepID=UPI0029C87112|nr:hypothetical protein [Variovorax paradoxus]WPH18252.1 hypothetical protein RZE78_14540 [Variovorax paradoxus]
MFDMGQIQAAVSGLGAVRELVKVGIDAKVDQKASEKVIDALSRLGAATDALYTLRDELFRLQTENEELKEAAKDREALAAHRAKYVLSETPGGAIVWHFSDAPAHYACPNCWNDKRIEILQSNRTRLGKYRCTAKECGAEFPIEKVKPAAPINYSRGIDTPWPSNY